MSLLAWMVLCMGQIAFITMLINYILNKDCVQIHQTCLLQWPHGDLDFQGKIFKLLYLRNGVSNWQETKVIWIEAVLDPLDDLDLWPAYDLDLRFSRSNFQTVSSQEEVCLARSAWHEMKGIWIQLIRCWTQYITLTFDPTHDFDLWFLRSNLLMVKTTSQVFFMC